MWRGTKIDISALNTVFLIGCPAALYALMSHPGVEEEGPKIYQLYMPSYQNKSCSVCLQDVYLTFLAALQPYIRSCPTRTGEKGKEFISFICPVIKTEVMSSGCLFNIFGQQTIDSRQQTIDSRQQRVDNRLQRVDNRQQTIDNIQQTEDNRQKTIDRRHQTEDNSVQRQGKNQCGVGMRYFFSKYLGIGTVSVILNTEKYRQNTAKIPH